MARGEAGAQWLRDLPDIVASLERDWHVTAGRTLPGGSAAYVAEAIRADGTSAILKVVIGADFDGHGDLHNEIATLLAAGGDGICALYAHDLDRRAMLLERLGPNLVDLGLSTADQLAAICSALRRVWRPVPGEALQSLADKGQWLADFIARRWEELGSPCDERVVETALGFVAHRLAEYDPERAVLLHGDAHEFNTLQDPAGGYKLIDPDGLVGEPAYDLSVPMREGAHELLAGDTLTAGRRRCELLSRLSGVPPQPIWEWGFVERVSTGLLLLDLGDEAEGSAYLDVATAFAAA